MAQQTRRRSPKLLSWPGRPAWLCAAPSGLNAPPSLPRAALVTLACPGLVCCRAFSPQLRFISAAAMQNLPQRGSSREIRGGSRVGVLRGGRTRLPTNFFSSHTLQYDWNPMLLTIPHTRHAEFWCYFVKRSRRPVQRRRPSALRMAVARAFCSPTRMTRRLPRVTPV
jgi:hypothetical protein